MSTGPTVPTTELKHPLAAGLVSAEIANTQDFGCLVSIAGSPPVFVVPNGRFRVTRAQGEWKVEVISNGWAAIDEQCGGSCGVETGTPAIWTHLPPDPKRG